MKYRKVEPRIKYRPIPPVPPRAVSDEGVKAVDQMVTLGVPQRAVARQLEIHWRTVSNIVHRKGAYAGVPK